MYSNVDAIKKMIMDDNIEEAKIRILNSIQMNNSMEYFTELMDYLDDPTINIFSEDNGYEIILDKAEWTDIYLAKIRSKLKFNFSKEKLKHYNDIIIYLSNEKTNSKAQNNYVRKDTNEQFINTDSRRQDTRVNSENRYNETNRNKQFVNTDSRRQDSRVNSENRYSEKDRNKQFVSKNKTNKSIIDSLKVIFVILACTCTIVFFIKFLVYIVNYFDKSIK